MAINPDDLQRRLCDQLCAAVRVELRPDGELMLAAEFESPDGDRYPIYLSDTPRGVRLSDWGNTLMPISYDHDIDAFLAGSRGLLVERILGEERVGQDRGVFYLDTPTDRLSDAVFRYGRETSNGVPVLRKPTADAASARPGCYRGPAPDPAAHGSHGDGGDLPAAAHERSESGAPGLSLSPVGPWTGRPGTCSPGGCRTRWTRRSALRCWTTRWAGELRRSSTRTLGGSTPGDAYRNGTGAV